MTNNSSENSNKHIVVIGAGPGGYTAAFYAADLGFKVTLINREARPGGTCLLRGCIPSKGLLHAATLINEAKKAAAWGIKFEDPEIDIDKLRQFKDEYVKKLSDGIAGLAKARKVEMVEAVAEFKDEKTLKLTDSRGNDMPDMTFDHCVIATGSSAVVPGVWEMKHGTMMDSTGALALENIPKKLLVIGGGYIGLEMATVYAALGSKVTVVEAMDTLLPTVDRDLVRILTKSLEKRMDIHTGVKVDRIKQTNLGAQVSFDWQASRSGKVSQGEPEEQAAAHGDAPLHFDKVLVAIGRSPNTRNLKLMQVKIETDEKGFIVVDEKGQTASANIWAIGDVAGEPMLAHKASSDARIAIDAIAGNENPGQGAIPAVIFTDPEMAWVGLTENEAKNRGIKVAVSRFPWAASGKALSQDAAEGLTKLIFDPETGKLLGGGIVGPSAGDLINQVTTHLAFAATAEAFSASIYPHPTLSESLLESAEAFLGISTHLYRPKRG